MTDEVALVALNNVPLLATASYVTYFVAFEAGLLGAREAVMRVLPTQNTVRPLCLIDAISSNVTVLQAISALNCGVVLCEVPTSLVLHLLKSILLICYCWFYFTLI